MSDPASAPKSTPAKTTGETRGPWVLAALLAIVAGTGVMLSRPRETPVPQTIKLPIVEPPATPAPTPKPEILPTFELGEITQEEIPDEAHARRFKVRVPITKAGDAAVTMRDVVIEVRFYDKLMNGDVVTTRANVMTQWASSPVDWLEPEGETLEVEYTLPKPAGPAEEAEGRQYHGYLVRLYYEDRRQAVAALPEDLIERFPTPTIRPTDEAP